MKKLLLSISALVLSCLQLNAQAVPTSSLFAYFPFTNNLTITSDSSGNGRHLFQQGYSTSKDRFMRFQTSVGFDGNTQYLANINGGTTMGISGNNISISFWYRTQSSAYAGFIDNSRVSESYGIDNFGGNFRFLGGGNFSAPIFQPDGQWHHIVFTKNGTKGIFYKDGIASDSTNAMTAIAAPTGTVQFNIGRRNNSTSYFNGNIDDVALYTRALSATEISTIYNYNGGPLVINNNLFASYPFTNGSMLDFSANSNDLQNTFSTVVNDRFNQPNNAMNFNAPSNTNLTGYYNSYNPNNGNTITISFWYKTSSTTYAGIIDNALSSTGFGIDNYAGNIRFLGGGNFSAPIFQPNGEWHHIVFTKNGSKGIFYKDGIATDSTNTMIALTAPSGGQDMTIGCRNNSATGFYNSYFTGQLDDISIYANTLTASQVTALYQQNGYSPLGPVVNPSNTIGCAGSTYILSINSANATSYQWNKNGVPLSNNANYSGVNTGTLTITNFSPSLTGTYTAYYANTFTNNITPSTTGVYSIAPTPTISIASSNTMLCVGQTSTLTASGGGSYQWNNNTFSSSIAVNPTVSTIYSATVTSAQGCTNTASFTQSVSTCTGIKDQENETALSIYPNPTNSLLFIESPSISGSATVQLTDVTGRIVVNHTITTTKEQIDISDLNNGIYFLSIKNNGQVLTRKIIKE